MRSTGSAADRYFELCYGKVSRPRAWRAELTFSLLAPLPGAAGILLRGRFYPPLFAAVGPGTLFGRNITFRHPAKIRLGTGVILDDGCLIDAKGVSNTGITLGDNVYIGRNSLVYCKNGNIELQPRVNVSSTCTLFSSNQLQIGSGTLIGAYSYLLSGGEYDTASTVPFADQPGTVTRGPLLLGANCWLGAHVTVLDAACIGDNSVIGAGAVVTKPVPARSLALGVPARVVKAL